MTIDEVIAYFGNLNRVMKALGLASQNMTAWKRNGYIPLLQQYRIAELTSGALMPDDDDPKFSKQRKRELLTKGNNYEKR